MTQRARLRVRMRMRGGWRGLSDEESTKIFLDAQRCTKSSLILISIRYACLNKKYIFKNHPNTQPRVVGYLFTGATIIAVHFTRAWVETQHWPYAFNWNRDCCIRLLTQSSKVTTSDPDPCSTHMQQMQKRAIRPISIHTNINSSVCNLFRLSCKPHLDFCQNSGLWFQGEL